MLRDTLTFVEPQLRDAHVEIGRAVDVPGTLNPAHDGWGTGSAAAGVPPRSAAMRGMASSAESGDGANTDAEFERAAKRYRKSIREGETFYCRREKPLGSRLPMEYCLTEAQLRAEVRKVENSRDQMSLPKAGPCGSPLLTC